MSTFQPGTKVTRFKVGNVEVDYRGLGKWLSKLKVLGTLEIGLFDSKNAKKGHRLEYGYNENGVLQPARPWLRGAFLDQAGSKRVHRVLIKEIKKVFLNSQTMNGVAKEVAKEVQDYLLNQRFKFIKLADVTVRLKVAKGSAFPTHIGIETGEMLDAIEGRFSKGTRRK